MNLSEAEKKELQSLIDRGAPLPERYRWLLFQEPRETELIWPGKTHEVTSVVLPFQSIEQIDEPRTEGTGHTAGLFDLDLATGRQTGGWSNKLIWGDNKLVLSSLKNGPLRREIEDAGGLKLVYIDPPFDVGADFSFEIEVGDDSLVKESTAIEELAYRDTWGRGIDSYFSMISERLSLLQEILSPDGSLIVHCDWRVSPGLRLILDEKFGAKNFRNEIYWYYYNKMPDTRKGVFPRATDTLLWYVKDSNQPYHFEPLTEQRETPVKQLVRKKVNGRMINARDDNGDVMYTERSERVIDNVWRLSMLQPADNTQNLRYATQKPEHLLSRVIEACSAPDDLIADFFCGSGTTLAVAEKLGRKWIGCDLGRFAIHTTRKRMIGVQRELKAAQKAYRSFEILNLGKYERQYFAGIDPTLPEAERRTLSIQKEEHYLTLILAAYKSERLYQTPPFHGKKAGALVFVGPIDAPVTETDVAQAVATAKKLHISKIDILGFEFEMGLNPKARDDARKQGVEPAFRYIPKDVFDKRAVESGQVVFYDVAYVEVKPHVSKLEAIIELKTFGVFYRQETDPELKGGSSKVVIENGQVVKVSKDKGGIVSREILTKSWSDWVDYWAVDFDYGSRPETIRVMETGPDGLKDERSVRTGAFIFENEWQSFRTRKNRKLELKSAAHTYQTKGKYKIAVKVIDIFGNDTTKVIEVTV